jgi:hypothetical protein
MFSQKLHVLTICTINIPGSFVNRSVLQIHQQRSLRVQICRSATGTCSSREHLLRVTPSCFERLTEGLKLPVSLDYFKQKSALDVYITNGRNVGQNCVGFCTFEPSDGSKLNGTTHGHQEWHFVDFHSVNT